MTMATEGRKDDAGKTRHDLFSPLFEESVARVLTHGAENYGAYNWMKGILYSRVYAALRRHLNMWWRGERLDVATGEHHLAHAACCIMFLLHFELAEDYLFQQALEPYKEFDDRPNIATK